MLAAAARGRERTEGEHREAAQGGFHDVTPVAATRVSEGGTRSKAPSVPSPSGKDFRVRVSDARDSVNHLDPSGCPCVPVRASREGARRSVRVVLQNAGIHGVLQVLSNCSRPYTRYSQARSRTTATPNA